MKILIIARTGEGGKRLAERFAAWGCPDQDNAVLLDPVKGAAPLDTANWVVWVQDESHVAPWMRAAELTIQKSAPVFDGPGGKTWHISH